MAQQDRGFEGQALFVSTKRVEAQKPFLSLSLGDWLIFLLLHATNVIVLIIVLRTKVGTNIIILIVLLIKLQHRSSCGYVLLASNSRLLLNWSLIAMVRVVIRPFM